MWKTSTQIAEKVEEGTSMFDDRATATSLAWVLPTAELCALYSIPMDKLEAYVIRVGNIIVGSAGAYCESEYLVSARHQKLVVAPCRLRKVRLSVPPSPVLTECLSRTRCVQELALAA